MLLPHTTPPSASKSSSPTPSQRDTTRVLIVDDDVHVARSFSRILRAETVSVSVTHSAASALELLTEESFDLVICDVIMPETSGLELYRKARDQGVDVSTFAFVTGGALIEGGDQAVRNTGCPLLHKPVDADDLRALLPTKS